MKPAAHHIVHTGGSLRLDFLPTGPSESVGTEGHAVRSSEQWFWFCCHNLQFSDIAKDYANYQYKVWGYHKIMIEHNIVCSIRCCTLEYF